MNVFHLPGAIVGDPRCNCVMCERTRLEKRNFKSEWDGICKQTGQSCMYDCPNGACWGELPTGTRQTDYYGVMREWDADSRKWTEVTA